MFTGPSLIYPCYDGSMVTLTSGTEAILVGCKTVNYGKIFKLTWQGEHLKWVELQQRLNYPRWQVVAMLIPNSKTNCNKR